VALFERLRLPPIAGFLAAGALLGPAGLAVIEDSERVRVLAEFGVVFLLFEIGLEMPVDLLRRLWRTVLAAGVLQVGGTTLCVFLLATGFGVAAAPAFVLGGLVAMSSTALVMRLLSSSGQVDAPHGQLAVGILLFQDLCIVPLLLAVPVLAGQGGAALGVLRALVQGAAALALLVLTARFLLPRVLHWAVQLRSGDLVSLVAFLLVLGFSVAAEALGLTLAVGAFTAGLLLAASPYAHQFFAEVAPVRGVLLGVFFTAVGMLFHPVEALAVWPLVLAYVGAVVVLKTAIIVLVVGMVLRRGVRLALLTGLGLAQTGEFSFVLGGAALGAGLLDPVLHQVFVAGSILTLVATPLLFAVGPRLAARLSDVADRFQGGVTPAPRQAGHAVLVGFGLGGRTLARVLASTEIPYVAVDANPTSVAEARDRGEPVVFGDATRAPILERLSVNDARLVNVALTDPVAARRCVAMVRDLAPQTRIIARTHYVAEVDALSEAGADEVVVEEFEAGIELVRVALRAFQFPVESVERFTEQMRDEGYELMRAPPALALDPWLTEVLSEVGTDWLDVSADTVVVGRSIESLDVRRRTGASVLAVERQGQTTANPDPSLELAVGDRLLLFGSAEDLANVRKLLRGDDLRPRA